MTDTDLAAAIRVWIALDPDPETRGELAALLDGGRWDTLADRFDGRVAFGTAGLRAPMHGGPTGMNRLVVRQSAAGIARYLVAHTDAVSAGIVIAFDARRRSDVFAAECATVIAAHGIPVTLAERALPTPVGVFAVTHLGAAAGIVITASHNPPADNGLKLFMGDGAQIVSPVDADVAARIDAVVADGRIEPAGDPAPITPMSADVVAAYRRSVLASTPTPTVWPSSSGTRPEHVSSPVTRWAGCSASGSLRRSTRPGTTGSWPPRSSRPHASVASPHDTACGSPRPSPASSGSRAPAWSTRNGGRS